MVYVLVYVDSILDDFRSQAEWRVDRVGLELHRGIPLGSRMCVSWRPSQRAMLPECWRNLVWCQAGCWVFRPKSDQKNAQTWPEVMVEVQNVRDEFGSMDSRSFKVPILLGLWFLTSPILWWSSTAVNARNPWYAVGSVYYRTFGHYLIILIYSTHLYPFLY